MLKRLKTDFVSSVLILVSGTVFAQIIAYSLSPIITRLYSPEEMSYLSLFSRIITFLAVIATARFELAFPLPKRDEHAFSLYNVSLRITLVTTFVACVFVLGLSFYPWTDTKMYFILGMIPLGIFVVAFYNQGVNWAIRTKSFKSISISKVLSTTFNSISTVALGLLSFGYMGLILGFIFGNILSAIPFIKPFLKARIHQKSFVIKGRNFAIARHYLDFPMVNLPHVLIDLSKELFIAFYLIYTFEKDILGLYDFSFRMLKLPISIIGLSISQVFFNKAAVMMNEGKSIFPLAKKTVGTLLVLSIVPFGILFYTGGDLFAFVFGEPWRKAGEFSEIMSPWLMMNFLVSPISQIPIILKKQRSFLVLSIFGTGILIVSLLLGDIFPSWNLTFEDILRYVSAGQFIFLTYVVFWTIWLTKKYSND